MAKTKIDVTALSQALEAARNAHGWSWRQLAKEVGVSPSLLSRLNNGLRPDADGFVTLTRWLRMPADSFIVDEDRKDEQPELTVELAPLLRARNFTEADVAYVTEVIQATVRRVEADQANA